MTPPIRLLALALALSGCTIVAPDLHVTSVSFPTVVAGAPAASSSEPWPSHGPSSEPSSPVATGPQVFSGNGPQAHIGPVHLPSGKVSLHVVFESDVAFNGAFALELDDPYDRFQANLASGTGSFDRMLTPSIAISGDHYLAVTAADGRWTVALD